MQKKEKVVDQIVFVKLGGEKMATKTVHLH